MADYLIASENDYSSLSREDPTSPRLRVAVIIPVFNRVELLRLTLAGLTVQTYPHELMSVVVADDGSDEDIASDIEGLTGNIRHSVVKREHDGYGAGQARNLGASTADSADVLVFFDADCIPDPEAVERHAVWHHMAKNLVVIGSRHHLDTSALGPDIVAAGTFSLRHAALGTGEPQDWASDDYRRVLHRRTSNLRTGDQAFRSLVSSNFSVRRSDFLAVGGFSEDFHRWGGEDTELGWRLWNSGAYFVDEPRAAIYHQIQQDEGVEGWRDEGRSANDGLIQSKIPHRFYRSQVDTINEVPKVSVIVFSTDGTRLDELTSQVLAQRLNDLELILVGGGAALTAFAERRIGDPRFGIVASIEEAMTCARGEFTALVHGSTALDHRLLSRSVAALERRPRAGWVRAAYGVPTSSGMETHRRPDDIDRLDQSWAHGLPLFGMTRTRDLMKSLRSGGSAAQAWDWVTSHLEPVAHGSPLVVVPALNPTDPRPDFLEPPSTLRSMILSDLKAGGARAVSAPVRAFRAKLTRGPYRDAPTQPTRAPELGSRAHTIRYVGWTGQGNLGDEAMFEATRDLFAWADVSGEGQRADTLLLGGGTLINRGYLKRLRPFDSPRIERITFGTGVAHPEYWGKPKEDPREWIAFLESCLFVGVRGPRSAELLSDWGLRQAAQVIGDPALSLPQPNLPKVDGRIVVCPAWSRGLLWGGSDEDVFASFASIVRQLLDDGHDVWVLSAFPADDTHIIAMMRDAGTPDLPYLAGHDDPAPALELLASAELVVSERLHGAVLAAAAGTVPVMVEYRPKLRDFAQSVGLQDLAIRTDAVNGDALLDLVRSVWERREELSRAMSGRVNELRNLQSEAAREIKKALT